MSRAFVRESDGDGGEPLPERAISPHPNLVTPEGMRQIEAQVKTLEAALRAARAAVDTMALAQLQRDLRYWTQRRASARLVPPLTSPDAVRFGVQVLLRFEDGSERSFRLVGEDEADPGRGLVSWVSPLATALTGRTVGDSAQVMGRTARIESLAASG